MTKEIFIRISGLHMEEGQENPEPVEIICPGLYYKKGDKHYIIYEEVQSGTKVVAKNVIKIKKGYYEVIKHGQIKSHLIFEEGKKHTTLYETPYGSIFMDVYTNSILFEEKEAEFKIQINYELEVNGEKLEECIIKMNVEAKNSEKFIL